MRGHNEVWISGNVGGKIVVSKTRDDREACSFQLASENSKSRTTWVRINVYDGLAENCKNRLRKGIYCTVLGELMNREGQYGELTEIRARDVIFFEKDSNEEDRRADESAAAE